MIISIRESLEIPIFQQIHNQIIQGISDGRLQPGEQLPTVRALADEMGINAMTVSKAYQLLKQEGYILGDRRNGARVREDFSQVRGLSHLNRELLQQIASEAKLGGMSREAFLELCDHLYPTEQPEQRDVTKTELSPCPS